MVEIKLRNLCQDLLQRWRKKGAMDEEQSYLFAESIFEMLSDPESEPGEDYRKLSQRLNEVWQYRNLGGFSPEEAFLYGSLWGMVQVLETGRRRERQDREVKRLARSYRGKMRILEAIFQNPGIRHKDLAVKGGQSPSQLSQLIAAAVRDDLVTYNRVGREKYYYLQRPGRQVYEEMARQKRAESRKLAGAFPYKWISRTNDEMPYMVHGIAHMQESLKKPNMCKNQMASEDAALIPFLAGVSNAVSSEAHISSQSITLQRGSVVHAGRYQPAIQ